MTDFLSMLESIAHGVFDAALISLGAFAVAVFVGVIPGVSLALRHRAWSLATILPLFALCSVLSGEFLYHEATGPTTYHLGPISDPFDLTLQKASRPLVTSAALRASPERLLGHAPTIHSFVALSSFLSLGAAIWALVALCSVAWLFWCFVGDIAVARTARRRDPLVSEEARSVRVGVRVSDDIDIPAALGLGQRVVIIPTRLELALSQRDLRCITAHEAAHLARRDDRWDLLERLSCAIMWVDPFVHLSVRLARRWRERACDQWAAKRVGPRNLAEALWRSASSLTNTRRTPSLPFWTEGGILERGRALLRPAPSSRTVTMVAASLVYVVFAGAAAFAALRGPSYWWSDVRVVSTASMHDARAGFSAVKLRDGRVLVAGGYASATTLLSSAELYDSSSGTFARVGSLAQKVAGAQATLLPDGRVLLTGGRGVEGPSSDVELFDPNTLRFERGPSLHVARSDHTATLVKDGTVFIAGGFTPTGPTRSTEIYDPVHDTFRVGPNLRVARAQHTATLLADGRVIFIGGVSASGTLRSSDLYVPQLERVAPGPEMTVSRAKHGAVLLKDGTVLVLGGTSTSALSAMRSVERYDPARNSFSSVEPMHFPRINIGNSLALLPNGRVLVAGGQPVVELYSPKSHRFILGSSSLGDGRNRSAAILLDTCSLLVVGGYGTENGRVSITKTAVRVE